MSNESIKIPFKIKGEFKIPDNIKTKSSKRIIAGYASIVELDVYDEIIPHEALKEGLKTLISDEHYANLMLSHSDIQVGKILKSWGKLKTHVDKKGLFIVAELRDDINAANDAWEMILSGEMRGFSIGGEVIKEHGEATKGGREWTVLDKINLFEVSICSFPANEKSGFIVISKSIKSYECECLDCGDTVESNEHCKDIECPSCGGEMRRVDRQGDGDKKSKSKLVTKSPACRQEDETKDECVSRKIPEIMDEGYDQDQAIAMANSMCSTACSDKSKSCEIDSGDYSKYENHYIKINKDLPDDFYKLANQRRKSVYSPEMILYKKFLGAQPKDMYINRLSIPMALMGSYLYAHKSILGDDPLEVRRFDYEGECPPVYFDIKLNSKKSDSLLLDGIAFYKNKTIYKVYPTLGGIQIEIITNRKDKSRNNKIMSDIHKWVKENNFLRGEKFTIYGEFITVSKKSWDDIFINKNIRKSVERAVKIANKEDFVSRGMLFCGPPGNGKTLTGKIMFNNLKCSCIWITAKDFSDGIYDASKIIGEAYRLAKLLGPTVIFMEDIDNWLSPKTIDALKTEMDGLSENRGVLTILTSNNPDSLPDALLDRPGRFHDILMYEAPNSDARKNMIKGMVEVSDKVLEDIVKQTNGYSGAYIKELIDLANLISDEDEIKIEEALHKSLTKIEHHKNLVANIRQNKNVKEELSNDDEEKSEEVKIDMKTKEGCTMSKDKKEDVKDNIKKDESVEDDVKDTKSEETEESEETSTKEEEEDSEPAFNLNDVMQRLEAVEGTVRQILEGSEEEAEDEDEEDEEDYEEEEKSDSDKEDKPDNDVEKENEESDKPEKDEEESGEKEKSVEKSKDKDDEEIKVLQKSISDKDEHIKELEKTVNKLNAKIKELEETEEPAKTVIKKEDDFDDDVEDDKVIVKRQGKEIFLDDWE